MSQAYKKVKGNKGSGGIDKMDVESLRDYLVRNKDELMQSIMGGTYRPNPVRRVEIPKENGKMRMLGIPKLLSYYFITVSCRNRFPVTNIRESSLLSFE
jgi:retron-type reverse transcriptase